MDLSVELVGVYILPFFRNKRYLIQTLTWRKLIKTKVVF